jgi:hypothetical protein
MGNFKATTIFNFSLFLGSKNERKDKKVGVQAIKTKNVIEFHTARTYYIPLSISTVIAPESREIKTHHLLLKHIILCQ